jgi:type I restriction enzyme, S subunit
MTEWAQKAFSDFASLQKGISYKSEEYAKDEDGAIFLTIKCVSKAGGFKPDGIKYYAGHYSPRDLLEPDEVLIANTDLTRAGDIVGCPLRVPDFDGRVALMSMDLSKVRIDQNQISPTFLYYLLMTHHVRKYMKEHASGSTVLHLQTSAVPKLQFCIPASLTEQNEIAEILYSIDRAIIEIEALLAKQQRIKIGLMEDLLTKGIDEDGRVRSEETHRFEQSPIGLLPHGWQLSELKTVAKIVDPNPSHRYPPSSYEGTPIVSTENFLDEDGYDLSSVEYVPYEIYEQQNRRCEFREDDIVFARKGRLGLARRLGSDKKVFSHTVVLIKPRNKEISAEYLLWLVRSRDFFHQIDRRMNSNSGVPTLGIGFLGAVPVRLAPISEQNRISDVLNACAQEIAASKVLHDKLVRLKRGLMKDLLTGHVRVAPAISEKEQIVGAVA